MFPGQILILKKFLGQNVIYGKFWGKSGIGVKDTIE